MVVVNALIFGLVLAVLIGPVFFTLLQTSIEKGLNKAILVAIGIFFSDVVYINLAYFGLSQFINDSEYKEWIGYTGGGILIVFGIVSLFKSRKKTNIVHRSVSVKGFFRYIFKGFIINGVSPFVLLFWLGAMSMATIEYGYSGETLVLFFGVIMLIVFITDVIKAYLAGKLRALITPRLFTILNVAVGLALIAFGLRMFVYSW
ncbi:LysE family transporter [Fulvivirga sp. 29W222]|uniref:LysE family transporter n=1 Tax=Fulvivirga marina TaxID=2494733 RepID=A0A937KBE0_9BACT|nr:LysE family transporter [Fulvivirga marina]MBL6445982.1 LysE family transporter [Fulvivirga marina]